MIFEPQIDRFESVDIAASQICNSTRCLDSCELVALCGRVKAIERELSGFNNLGLTALFPEESTTNSRLKCVGIRFETTRVLRSYLARSLRRTNSDYGYQKWPAGFLRMQETQTPAEMSQAEIRSVPEVKKLNAAG